MKPSLRTLRECASISGEQLKAVNSMLSHDDLLERACPKALRAPPLIIGVAGGTASGKTTVCLQIQEKISDDRVRIISMDNFYRPLTPAERERVADYNFDHPDAFDVEEIVRCLDDLRSGKAVEVPLYDFKTHSRCRETELVQPAEVILFEGILVLHMPAVVKRLNMKVYVDTDDDLRLSRRILRDVEDRGRDVAGVIKQYTRFVKPAQDKFVTPSRKIADVIIPWHDRMNMMAVELVTEHLKIKLKQHPLVRQYPNLDVMPESPLVKEMHTIIRDTGTNRNDFVFYADRLIRLVVEMGLGYLPFREKSIQTPEGYNYVGVDFARSLCGVSIVWSGEAMEAALRDCCQGIKIGKILVQRKQRICDDMTNPSSPVAHEDVDGARARTPQPADDVEANLDNTSVKENDRPLVYDKLPADIATRHVLLMDPILSSGYTVVRAIETLLDRGVKEDKIYMLCLIAAPQGIHAVCKRFPKIRVLTSEIDMGLNDNSFAIPGIGNFGDRYFHL